MPAIIIILGGFGAGLLVMILVSVYKYVLDKIL